MRQVPLLWVAAPLSWATFQPEKEQPHMASKGVAILAGATRSATGNRCGVVGGMEWCTRIFFWAGSAVLQVAWPKAFTGNQKETTPYNLQ